MTTQKIKELLLMHHNTSNVRGNPKQSAFITLLINECLKRILVNNLSDKIKD